MNIKFNQKVEGFDKSDIQVPEGVTIKELTTYDNEEFTAVVNNLVDGKYEIKISLDKINASLLYTVYHKQSPFSMQNQCLFHTKDSKKKSPKPNGFGLFCLDI